jgi:hypothetical protein
MVKRNDSNERKQAEVDLDEEEEVVQSKTKKSNLDKENINPSSQKRVTRSQNKK